ncbi:HD domain-containing protein [Sulfurimonas paralvinellae]|uniref:HD domain-containing protein n=1 Tax=Sulfurimonas paralvinellae TaxID=317658 RepID=A0A7M1BAA5_9BACT|nr:HD domain-containing protein [Sulfurimonas paralvinellae]
MFKNHSCNMSNKESYIRFLIGVLLVVFAALENSFVLSISAVILLYTAYKRFCFMYALFHINERFGKQNYYLSLLPKYRSLPIFIFDKEGKILFENRAAEKEIANVHSKEDLPTGENDIAYYEYNGIIYQIEYRKVPKEELLLAYFDDVTNIVKLNKEIEDTQREVIYAMGEIGETRSKETGNHVKRVAEYSKILALLYGLKKEEAEKLKMASPMHDIGKVGIPDAILNAPRKLTKEEFEIMKTHAQLGYDMLKHSHRPILQTAAIVAGEHHEKYDGSGYPRELQGEDIHIYGRITAIADVFDALGSERVYKKAWELERILELFKQEKGKHFDPKLVNLFLQNLDKFLEIRERFKDI